MSTTAIKQQFLRQNVLAKGFDGLEFSTYLEKSTGGTFDIDAYTLEELRVLVEGFEKESTNQEFYAKNKNYPSVPEYPGHLPQQEDHESDEEDHQTVGNSFIGDFGKNSGFFKTMRVAEIYPNILSQTINPKVKISNPEKHSSNNILQPSYTVYTVETMCLGWSVKRRYKDFYWLQNMLNAKFPAYFVRIILLFNHQKMTLPPKTLNKTDPKCIKLRLHCLQVFIDAILSNKSLCFSDDLEKFLMLEDSLFSSIRTAVKLHYF